MKQFRNWSKYVRWLLFALAFLGGALAAFVIGFRYYVRWGMSPAEIAELERFSEPVQIPEEWQKIEPFSPELLAAVDKVRDTWHLIDQVSSDYWEVFDKLRHGQDPSQEWDQAEEAVQKAKPCTDALKVMVATPGYVMNALPAEKPFGPWPRVTGIVPSVNSLCLRGYYRGHKGEYGLAFEDSIDALRLLKRHPASPLIVHMCAQVGQRVPCHTISELTRDCEDADILEQSLDDLNLLAPDLVLNVLDDPRLVGIVGSLRSFSRLGYEVDLSSGKPRSYYFCQNVDIYRDWTARHKRMIPFDDWSSLEEAFYSTPLGGQYLYSLGIGGLGRMREHELTGNIRFDLTRLALASRIVELRTGATPTGMDDLVPECFAEPLLDPFSKQPYLWSGRWKTFYSVGPNKTPELDSMTLDEEGHLDGGDDIVSLPPK